MKKVLVIEDEKIYQDFFKESLNGKVELLQAYNLEEGERLYKENKDSLDVVVCDGKMPKANSTFENMGELANTIRKNSRLVMISISGDTDIRETFKKMKFDHILEIKVELAATVLAIISQV